MRAWTDPIFLVMVLALCGCGRDVDVGAAMQRAQQSFATGDSLDALAEIKTVLWADPEHPEAHLLMAQVQHGLGDWRSAQVELTKAMALGVGTLEARVLEAELKLASGDLEALKEALQAGGLGDLPVGTAERLLAEVLLGLGDYAQAEQVAVRYLETAPADYRAQEILARVLLARGMTGEAWRTIDAVNTAFAEYARGWITRSRILQARGEHVAAIEDATRALSLTHSQTSRSLYTESLVARTESEIAIGDLAAARAGVVSLEELIPGSVVLYWLKAGVALRAADYREATVNLQQLLAQQPEHPEAQLLMGVTYLQRGLLGQAEVYFERIVANRRDDLRARKLLAETHLRQDRPDEAVAVLTEATQAHDAEALMLLGRALVEAGRVQEAASVLARDADLAQMGNLAGFQLALALIAAQRYDEARELLEASGRDDPSAVTPRVGLAGLEWSQGRFEAAAVWIDSILAEHPDNLLAIVARGHLMLEEGDAARAAVWLERAESVDAGSALTATLKVALRAAQGRLEEALDAAAAMTAAAPQLALGHRFFGSIALRLGRFADAVAALQRALDLEPSSSELRVMLARAYAAQGQTAEAEEALEEALILRPRWLPAVEAQARILAATARADQALALTDELRAWYPERYEPHVLRGDLLMRAARVAEAGPEYSAALAKGAGEAGVLRLFQTLLQSGAARPEQPLLDWLARDERSFGVRFALAQYYQTRGLFADARAQYELLIRAEPDNPLILNNLALILHELDDDGSVAMARRAHTLLPDSGAITDTIGWLLVQAGQTEEGVELLELAADQAPDLPEIRYHLAAALVRQGQRERAREVLDALLASGAEFNDRSAARALRAELGPPSG